MTRRRLKAFAAACTMGCLLISGCSDKNEAKLDPKKPVTITIWHYYNGPQKTAFDKLVDEFNQTVGVEKGIIVEDHSQSDVNALEESVMAAVRKDVGSGEVPNIFSSYADTAYEVEKMGMLVDLDQYLTEEEKAEYVDSYIQEGRIGRENALEIFPTVKSTEVFMLNKTDWEPFAEETGLKLDDLATKEGVVRVAEKYYEWTDGKTPDIPDDGKAFYGRDAVANLFIIGAKQLSCELVSVNNQQLSMNLDRDVMRRIWDVYYLPRIYGYYAAEGRFRSDDAKTGTILSLTGSTSSAVYFPSEVTQDGVSHSIETLVLPVPKFEGGEDFIVQQGAGMVVTKSDEAREYASVLFLKWFTEAERNIRFSYESGYLPVKKEANEDAFFHDSLKKMDFEADPKIKASLDTALESLAVSTPYTYKAFDGGNDVRKILENHMEDKAKADIEKIKTQMAQGKSRREAAKEFDTDENFDAWYSDFQAQIEGSIRRLN